MTGTNVREHAVRGNMCAFLACSCGIHSLQCGSYIGEWGNVEDTDGSGECREKEGGGEREK
jgi:hypothetical protein